MIGMLANWTLINFVVLGAILLAILLVAVFVALLLKVYKLSPGVVGIVFDFVAIVLLLSNGFFARWSFTGTLWENPLWLLFLAFGVIFGLFAVSENDIQRIFGYIAISVPVVLMTVILCAMYVMQ
jgi:hypothetical protein